MKEVMEAQGREGKARVYSVLSKEENCGFPN